MLIKYSQNNIKENSVLIECIQNFQNELLLEAKILDVQKTPLKMTQNDIDFLHQFEPRCGNKQWFKDLSFYMKL